MNHIFKTISVLTGVMLFTFTGFSANLNYVKKDTSLTASRNNKILEYKVGTYVGIVSITGPKQINGRLMKVTQDSLYLESLNKKSQIRSIAIGNIVSVMKLHRKARKGWSPVLITLVLLAVGGIILAIADNSLAIALLALPVVSLFTFIPFLLATFLFDLFSKKAVKKGWVFTNR